MKRGGKLLVLLAALALVCVGAFAAVKYGEEEEAREKAAARETEAETYAVTELKKEDVTKLSWKYKDTEIQVEKSGDGWAKSDDEFFPVNGDVINELLDALTGISAAKEVPNTGDKSAFGFTEPEVTVTANGSAEYVFGKNTNLMEGRYLLLGGKVYIVDFTAADIFKKTEADIMKYDEIPEMSYVLAYTADSEVNDFHSDIIYVIKDGEERGTYYIRDDMERVISQDRTDLLMNNIYTTRLNNCVNYNASEEDMEAYGLKDPVMTIKMVYVNKEGEKGEFVLYIGNFIDDSGDYLYATVPGSKMVYKYDSFAYNDVLLKTYDYLEEKAKYDTAD